MKKMVKGFKNYLLGEKKLEEVTAKSYFDKFKKLIRGARKEYLMMQQQTAFLWSDIKLSGITSGNRNFPEIDEIIHWKQN